jgi:hypothetical protein
MKISSLQRISFFLAKYLEIKYVKLGSDLLENEGIYWSGSSSRQLSHLARALANFRLIFSPSVKDAIPILRINFYRISL